MEFAARLDGPFASDMGVDQPCIFFPEGLSGRLFSLLCDSLHLNRGVSPLVISPPRKVSRPHHVQDISVVDGYNILPRKSSPLPQTITRSIWSYRPHWYATPCLSA